MTRRPALALACALAWGAGVAAADPPERPAVDALHAVTEAALSRLAGPHDGVVAYVVQDLGGEERFERNPDLVLPTASIIKLAVLYEVFAQADAGRIPLDEPRPIDRRLARPGGLLYELGTPTLSVRDLAVAMIVMSDNTAANLLIERVGMSAVNARMAGLGLPRTQLRRLMLDQEAARRGDENVSTAGEVASLLGVFASGRGLSSASGEAARGILLKAKIGLAPLVDALPAGTPAASKSGELPGVRGEAAIVYEPARPYAIVVLTSFLRPDGDPDARRLLHDLSATAWSHFSRRGAASDLGRLLR